MRTLNFLFIFNLFIGFAASGQTLGGNAVFNFLKLPATPLLTAAGGVNVSYKTNEVGLSANNPALLDPDQHSQVNASFNNFLGDIKTYSLTAAYHYEKWNSTFAGHIYFVDYGSIPQTDAAGNVSGDFRPTDFVVQLSGSRPYLEKWNYGATVKFISSSYQEFTSNAIAIDFGVLYKDSANGFYASVLAKNMGTQLHSYAGTKEDLPFDLQIGATKRLIGSPFGFSLTLQQLHNLNILYSDTSFNSENGFESNDHFFNKFFSHVVLATHVYIGNNLEATLGYNHLRREELNINSASNGLNGFSMGLRLKFSKLQVMYARSNYQRNIAYNQFGVTMQLNKLFGLGKDM